MRFFIQKNIRIYHKTFARNELFAFRMRQLNVVLMSDEPSFGEREKIFD